MTAEESQGEVRVAAQLLLANMSLMLASNLSAEREREAAAAREIAAHQKKLYKDTAELSKSNTGKKKAAYDSSDDRGAGGLTRPPQFDSLSSRKMASAMEAYCEIAIAESNRRRGGHSSRKVPNVMGAFRTRMQAAVKRSNEQEAAA